MSAEIDTVTASARPLERCEMCRFWNGQRDFEGVDDFGECRRYPPSLVSAFLTNKAVQLADEEFNATRFPLTEQDEWCGEWQPTRQPTA